MKKSFALLLLLATMSTSYARQISEREATTIAEEFLIGETMKKVPMKNAPGKADKVSADYQPYYIFNADDNKGFVIVSGDDRAPKILGYSDKGNLDTGNIPPQLSWLLKEYAHQITNLPPSAPTDPSWTKSTVYRTGNEVLLETANWGQGAPYNLLCPKFDGEQSVTGCVATAMAIALEYLNHPNAGKGEYHYEYRGQDLSFNFEDTPFKWELISKSYDESSSEPSQMAVAELMLATGISVEMLYGTITEGSMAYMRDVAPALREYFDIGPSCQIIGRKHFTDSEWTEILINQIDNNNPVIYSADQGDWTAGHAWIIDGYNEDKTLFHQNFGWDGAGNGYYVLGDIQEGYVNFDQNQSMVINILPNSKGDKYSRAYVQSPYFHMAGEEPDESRGVKISVDNIIPGQPFDLSANSLILPSGFAGEYGYAIVSDNEEIKEILWVQREIEPVGYGRTLCPSMDAVGVVSHLDNLSSTDKVHVVTRYEGDTEWKLVLGSLDAPSWAPVKGNEVDASTVILDIDPALNIELMRGWYEENSKWESYSNNQTFNINKNSTLHFKITPKDVIEGKSIIFYVNDYFSGEMINRLYIQSIEKNEIIGFFRTHENEYKISSSYIIPIKEKEVIIDNAGSLSEKISKEDVARIESLTIKGKLNAYDFWYINDYFQSLCSLDISDVIIEECSGENNSQYGDYINPTQEKNILPASSFWEIRRLKTILLPSSIVGIGSNVLKICGLESITIPESVRIIGDNFMFGNYNLKTVTSLNNVPPVFNSEIGPFNSTQCFDNGTLYVPKGSKSAYESAQVWKNFTNIVEIDLSGINDVEISQSDRDNEPCDIFSPSGVCVFHGKSWNEINGTLNSGIYILRFHDGTTRKITIK